MFADDVVICSRCREQVQGGEGEEDRSTRRTELLGGAEDGGGDSKRGREVKRL